MLQRPYTFFVVFLLFAHSIYAQLPGGFSNPGQDVFKFDANKSYSGSVDQLTDYSNSNAYFSCLKNDVLKIETAAMSSVVATPVLIDMDNFTFEARVYIGSSGVSNNYLLNYNSTHEPSEGKIYLSVNTGKVELSYRNPSNAVVGLISYSPSLIKSAVHVGFTKTTTLTSETITLYVDGINCGSNTVTRSSGSARLLTLDCDLAEGDGADSFIGDVDEVRVWGVAISESQIKRDAYATLDFTNGAPANLLGCYNFNDQTNILGFSGNTFDLNKVHLANIEQRLVHISCIEDAFCNATWVNLYSDYALQMSGTSGYEMNAATLNSLSASTQYNIYAVIQTGSDIASPQVIYQESTKLPPPFADLVENSLVVYINQGLLKVTYAKYDGGVSYIGRDIVMYGLQSGQKYILNLNVDNSSNTITLFVDGNKKGSFSMPSAFDLASANEPEISFGVADNAIMMDVYDDALKLLTGNPAIPSSVPLSGKSFKGLLFESLIRTGENKTQQVITTNYFANKYGKVLTYFNYSLNEADYSFEAYKFLPPFSYTYTQHNKDLAGIGGIASPSDQQISAKSDYVSLYTTDQSFSSNRSLLLFAHNGAAKTLNAVGYNSNTDNAPLNVKIGSQEWKLTYSFNYIANQNYFNYVSVKIKATELPAELTLTKPEQQLVVVLDDDGDYRTGSVVAVLKLNTAGTEYSAENILLSSSCHYFMKIGQLNQYEFAATYNSQVIAVGKTINYEKLSGTDNILTIDNIQNLKQNDYILASYNTATTMSFASSPIVMNDQAGSPINVAVSNRIWKFNVYGNPGTIDIKFNGTALPALPAGMDRYVILLDADGVFDAATTKYYGLTDIASDKKAFFQALANGWYMRLGAAKQNLLQPSISEATLVQGFINGSSMNLNVSEQYSFPLANACSQELSKLELHINFNTGATHKGAQVTFAADAYFKIIGYSDYAGTNQLFEYGSVEPIHLSLNPDTPEQIWYADILNYYPNLKQVRVTLNSYNGSGEAIILSDLEINASLKKVKKIKIPTTTTSVARLLQYAKVDATQAASSYQFSWSTDECPAAYYQFQLLRLYNENPAYTVNPGSADLNTLNETSIITTIDWSKALTIETDVQTLQLLLTEGTGFYAWRVRPIGNYYPGGVADARNWGNWSSDNYPISSSLSLTQSGLSNYGNSIFWYDQFERNKNFIYQRSFTEGGNIHESIIYATGLLQSKQNIVRLNGNGVSTSGSDQELLVSQTLYDFAGRAALSSLPAPTNTDNDISYQEQFLQNSGQLYSPFHFDADNNFQDPLPIDGGMMNQYYSNANPDLSIPSAQGYGFTRQLFDDDGLNTLTEQSGVGPAHKITSDRANSHTVKIQYAGVSDDELILVFGDEAPKDTTVFKTITTDQNNTTSITYTNKEGKVIATCLTKQSTVDASGTVIPHYTDKLSSEIDPRFDLEITKVIDNNSPYGEGGLQASHTFHFTQPTDIVVSYEITPKVVKDVCGSYCATCGYQLQVNVVCIDDPSDLNRNRVYTKKINIITASDNSCVSEKFDAGNIFTIEQLPPGRYMVSKQVIPDKTEANTFATAVSEGEEAKMKGILSNLQSVLSNASSSSATIYNAYMSLINGSYSNVDYDMILTDDSGTELASSVGLTSGNYPGIIKRGYALRIITSCCEINVSVELPLYNPCEDPLIVNSTQVMPTASAGTLLADKMIELYANRLGIEVNGSFNYTTFKLVADQNATLPITEWNGLELEQLVSNLAINTTVSINQCKKLWSCWEGVITSIGLPQSAIGINTTSSLQQEYNEKMPDDGTTASSLGANMPPLTTSVVETWLDCYGRDYKAFTTDWSTYKVNAFRFFYRETSTLTAGDNYCDRMFCSKQDLTATTIAPDALCEPLDNCAIDYLSYGVFNTFQTRAINNGHTKIADNNIKNQALKACLLAFQTSPAISEHPDVAFGIVKQLADAEITRLRMINQCKEACKNKEAGFRSAVKEAFDPQHTGQYTYNTLGPELQLNGSFDNMNGQGWKSIGGSSYADGAFITYMQYYNLISWNNGYYGLQSAATLVPGKKYTVTLDLSILSNFDFGISVVNGSTVLYNTTNVGAISKEIEFTATASTLIFRYDKYFTSPAAIAPYVNTTTPPSGNPSPLGGYARIYNVSIREITGSTVIGDPDICCMTEGITDFCKNSCALDLVIEHCDSNPLHDKLVSIGTKEQQQRMMAILGGTFKIRETGSDGLCGNGWEQVAVDAEDKVPTECAPVGYAPAALDWDKAYFKGPLKDMVFDGNVLWAITGTNVYKMDKNNGNMLWSMTFTDHPITQIALVSGGFVLAGGNSYTYPQYGGSTMNAAFPSEGVENTLATDFVISKFTTTGTKLSTYTHTTPEFEQLSDIIVTSDNGIIMIGGVDTDNTYIGDLVTTQAGKGVVLDKSFAIKVNAAVTAAVWVKTYSNPSYATGVIGGRASTIAPSHTVGQYIIGAELYASTISGFSNINNLSSRIMSINESDGSITTDQPLFVAYPVRKSISVRKIIKTSDGYALGGNMTSDPLILNGQLQTVTGTDMFMLKTDKNLQVSNIETLYPTLDPDASTPTWLKSYKVSGNGAELTNLIQTSDGGFILCSFLMQCVKVDAKGNKIWDIENLVRYDDLYYSSYNYSAIYYVNVWHTSNYRFYGALYANSIFIDPEDEKMIVGTFKRFGPGATSSPYPALAFPILRNAPPAVGTGYPHDSWIAKVKKETIFPCTPRKLCIKWISPFPDNITFSDPDMQLPPPYNPPVPDPTDPTPEIEVAEEINRQTAQCKANRYASLVEQYMTACTQGKINDLLEVTYNQGYHHYTLYYYDRAGNLAATVPPEGVEPLPLPLTTQALNREVPALHRLKTKYGYNSIGQLVEQKTPDGGKTVFIYNAIGQLRFSQNAEQKDKLTFSYTKYDILGRIIEVGESALAGLTFDQLNIYADQSGSYTAFEKTSYPTAGNAQQTITVYSTPATQASYLEQGQTHLRNRVSYTYTYAINGERAVTYFSYDPHGNVSWLMQEIPGQSRNTIAYEYDLISNKVLLVKYNEGQNDAYYHKYEYDADNRITAVLTSRDQVQWDKDASYAYYKHGPLKRIEIGEDDVQGVDYTYTIQGWLKAINNPSLLSSNDYHVDGDASNSAFAGDEFGMVLNYYKGDFVHTGSIIQNSKTGTAGAYAFNSDPARDLFNGNISSWVSRVQEEYRDFLTHGGTGGAPVTSPTTQQYNKFSTANYYTYDDLNRITSSAFAEFDASVTSSTGDKFTRAGLTGKYATAYSYDGNGNINTLKRYSSDATGAAVLMDNMQYKYTGAGYTQGAKNESNQLESILEDASIGNNTFDDDIDPYSGTRYVYDKIGNLQEDKAEGMLIEWTVYGKVASVKRSSWSASGKPEVRYTYDASGNRIKKEVNHDPYSTSGVPQRLANKVTTTFYVRDASGNVMSIYERTNTIVSGQPGYYYADYDQIEIPIYGSSRVGMYKPDASERNVAMKKFQASDLDNMLYDRKRSPRSNYDTYWNVAVRESVSIQNTTAQNISISTTGLWNTQNEGDASTGTYNFTKTKAFAFSGKTGNGIAHALNANGQVQFTAVTAVDYYGIANKLLIYSGGNGLLMKGAESLTADPKAQIAITQVPGKTSQYYVIVRSTGGNIIATLVDMSLPGYGTTLAPQGEVVTFAVITENPYNLYRMGRSFLVRENKTTGKTILYTSRYSISGLVTELLAITLPSDIYGNALTEIMCHPTGLLEGNEEQGEIAINATGDKLIYYNQKKRLGWYSHQESEVLVYELGIDGKIAKNAIAAKYTIPVTDPSLPGSSAAISNDGRFVYYSKDQLYQTSSSVAHIWRYDTRNGNNAEVSGQNVAGDLRNVYSGLLVTVADNKSQTAPVLKETDQGITLAGTSIVFSASQGKISNWPLQNMCIYGGAIVPQFATRRINNKRYELSDHLGNVTVVVSDRKKGVVSGAAIAATAGVVSYTNYYAFGMSVKKRSKENGADEYRYGFNGQEREIETGENIYSAEFWEYDAKIARRWNIDPVKKEWESPYLCFNGDPINKNDISGDNARGIGIPGEEPGVVHIYGKFRNDNFWGSIQKFGDKVSNGFRRTTQGAGVLLRNASSFLYGVTNAVASNNVLGFGREKHGDEYVKAGQAVGDVVSVVEGTLEVAGGATLGVGGGAISVTGVGAIAGVPASAVGALGVAHGGSVLTTSLDNLVKADDNSYNAHGGNSGGSGSTNANKKTTPDTNPDDFIKKPNGQGYINKETGEIYKKSHTSHGNKGNTGKQWKVWPKGTKDFGNNSKKSGERTTIDGDGNIIGN